MVLLIDCPDEIGLVFRITKIVYGFNLNIISNDEFVDAESQHFFMRTEFTGDCDTLALKEQLQEELPSNSTIKLIEQHRKKVVLFASKEHQCLGEVLIRCEYKELNADVLAVISNHEKLKPLVDKYQIPFHFIDHRYRSREDHEAAILKLLETYDFDYLILAKYMRILTPTFVTRYNNLIINIHHSFLPAFKGANPYRQAFNRGVKIIGATAHFVNEDLDEGPIIEQDIIRINHRFSAKEMSSAGKDIEKLVLAKALKLVFDDQVFIRNNKTIIL